MVTYNLSSVLQPKGMMTIARMHSSPASACAVRPAMILHVPDRDAACSLLDNEAVRKHETTSTVLAQG